MYSLTVLKALIGPALSEGAREEPFLASPQLFMVASNPWCSLAYSCTGLISIYLYVGLCISFSSYKDFSYQIRVHPNPVILL